MGECCIVAVWHRLGDVPSAANSVVVLFGNCCCGGRQIESQRIGSFELSMSALKEEYLWEPDVDDFARCVCLHGRVGVGFPRA